MTKDVNVYVRTHVVMYVHLHVFIDSYMCPFFSSSICVKHTHKHIRSHDAGFAEALPKRKRSSFAFLPLVELISNGDRRSVVLHSGH